MLSNGILELGEEVMSKKALDNDYIPIPKEKALERMSYPSDIAIIGKLSEVIGAIGNITKKDKAMVGQLVISVLSASAQLNYRVRYFDEVGDVPLSLFSMIIAESGGGKTSVARLCNEGIKQVQQNNINAYQKRMAEYNAEINNKNGSKLIKPINPLFITNGGTTEGMIDVIQRNGHCYALIDEISSFIGGHSGKPENLLKTLGSISSLWSDAEITEVKRGNDDPRKVDGFLTLCVCGQPEIVNPIFNNPTWREQGTIPRFLVCEPIYKSSPRETNQVISEIDKKIVNSFNESVKAILTVDACANGQYIIRADKEAEAILSEFYNEMIEREKTDYSEIKSYTRRATEQAARLSGLLSLYNAYSKDCPMDIPKGDLIMTKNDVFAGVSLMRYYLHEYNRLSSGDFGKQASNIAIELFNEIRDNQTKWQGESLGYLTQTTFTRNIGRNKNKAKKEAFKLLVNNRYLIREETQSKSGQEIVRYRINQIAI